MERNFNPKLDWDSLNDDIINNFYRPALVNCELYQRSSGYFSSSTFANIINEIIEFIKLNGKIQLIINPNISETDKKIFEQSVLEREKHLADTFLKDLEEDPDRFKLEFTKLMAYMLTNQIDGKPQLEIKIAIPSTGSGIYHQKFGILKYKNGDRIAFAGSVNETGSGWGENVENFDAFRSWGDDTNKQGIVAYQKKFNELWNNSNPQVRIFDLPTAVKEYMLKTRPESDIELDRTIEKVKKILDDKHKRTIPDESTSGESIAKIRLRDYQNDAITEWTKNNFRGLLEMATGTGKTFTAFGCINKIRRMHQRTAIIIACPQLHLVKQWEDNFNEWNSNVSEFEKIHVDSSLICNSDNPDWQKDFEKILYDFNNLPLGHESYIKNHVLIFVTHKTLASSNFIDYVLQLKKIKKLLVIDEVHNITEKNSEKTLLEEYDFRLGLSATPVRHLDDRGTEILHNYFEGIVYTVDLKDAIYKYHALSHYEYNPYYVELTPNEMEHYQILTKKIAMVEVQKKKGTYHKVPGEVDPAQRRADLIANAENKDQKLKEILTTEFNDKLEYTLIYCTNNPSPASQQDSPKQLARVKGILTDRGIISDSVTWEDKTKDRRHILKLLADSHFDCVTAVRCLDEGVDIPSVRIGIFMASSGNPKQFIQRRGRILRKSVKTGKDIATIYDILVIPTISDIDVGFVLSQRKLIAKELIRHKEFASIADNQKDAIEKIREIANKFKIDFNKLDYEYIKNMN